MGKLLFSPEGRITSTEFIRGAVILLAVNFFLWPVWYLGLGAGFIAMLAGLFSIYCWCCLFTKRLHDSGKTGWLFLPLLVAFYILTQIFSAIFSNMFMTEEAEKHMVYIQEIVASQDYAGIDMEKYMEAITVISKATVVPGAISYFLSGAILAFGVNKLLKTDPEPNRWG